MKLVARIGYLVGAATTALLVPPLLLISIPAGVYCGYKHSNGAGTVPITRTHIALVVALMPVVAPYLLFCEAIKKD